MNDLLDICIIIAGILSFVSFLELSFETDRSKIRKRTLSGLWYLFIMLFLLALK